MSRFVEAYRNEYIAQSQIESLRSGRLSEQWDPKKATNPVGNMRKNKSQWDPSKAANESNFLRNRPQWDPSGAASGSGNMKRSQWDPSGATGGSNFQRPYGPVPRPADHVSKTAMHHSKPIGPQMPASVKIKNAVNELASGTKNFVDNAAKTGAQKFKKIDIGGMVRPKTPYGPQLPYDKPLGPQNKPMSYKARDAVKGAVGAVKDAGSKVASALGPKKPFGPQLPYDKPLGPSNKPLGWDQKKAVQGGMQKISNKVDELAYQGQKFINKNAPKVLRKAGEIDAAMKGAVGSMKGAVSSVANSTTAKAISDNAGYAARAGMNMVKKHPVGAGAAGLGLVGAAALAAKAYKNLRDNGNDDPSDDDLHDEMKKKIGTDDGHLNKNPQGMNSAPAHTPGQPVPKGWKMVFGELRKRKNPQ